MSIELKINGKKEQLNQELSLLELLKQKNIRPEVVAVELNDAIIDREKYSQTILKNGDVIELVYYMGGGAYQTILDKIGKTPLVKLNKITIPNNITILAKLEYFNPGGSVKDRVAQGMVEDAEKKGHLKPGGTIIEPTSGNTGIGLAFIAASKGYKCILTMPESMSLERLYILKSYGAHVILTPATQGITGSIKKAEELAKKTPNSFMPQQFKNPANPETHRRTTAKEIIEDTEGKIDAFVVAVGTGGTLTGVGEVLKKNNPNIKIIAVEPSGSAVLSGKKPGPHKIQGIGAGFIPDILNTKIIDEVIAVHDNDAFRTAKRIAKEEGLFVGISSGAALSASLTIAEKLGEDKTIVTVFPDTGERYFSMEQYFEG